MPKFSCEQKNWKAIWGFSERDLQIEKKISSRGDLIVLKFGSYCSYFLLITELWNVSSINTTQIPETKIRTRLCIAARMKFLAYVQTLHQSVSNIISHVDSDNSFSNQIRPCTQQHKQVIGSDNRDSIPWSIERNASPRFLIVLPLGFGLALSPFFLPFEKDRPYRIWDTPITQVFAT